MTGRPHRVTAVLVAALLGAAAHVAPAAAVRSASAGDMPITWSVRPADENGPDGRRVIDVVLEPGERTTEHVVVTNHSSVPVTFSITANDGYLTERGNFDMLPSGTPPTDGGSWLSVPDGAPVGAGESVVVPVEITVPESAEPGDHPAGVAASVISTGSEVAVESRVGVRVNLTVAGEAASALDATGWALPLLLLGLLVLALRALYRWRRARLQLLLARARAEGAADARAKAESYAHLNPSSPMERTL